MDRGGPGQLQEDRGGSRGPGDRAAPAGPRAERSLGAGAAAAAAAAAAPAAAAAAAWVQSHLDRFLQHRHSAGKLRWLASSGAPRLLFSSLSPRLLLALSPRLLVSTSPRLLVSLSPRLWAERRRFEPNTRPLPPEHRRRRRRRRRRRGGGWSGDSAPCCSEGRMAALSVSENSAYKEHDSPSLVQNPSFMPQK